VNVLPLQYSTPPPAVHVEWDRILIASAMLSMSSSFDWRLAPLSSVQAPVIAGTTYTVVVLTLSKYMSTARGGRGIEGGVMRLVQAGHNLLLCVASLIMFVGTLSELLRRRETESTRWMFCEDPAMKPTGSLYFWSYLYYLSKYYELFDTVLQLLKGRPPPHFFLHVYHHAVVLLMAWSWLEYCQTLQFGGLIFNTAVIKQRSNQTLVSISCPSHCTTAPRSIALTL
jgi:hypothetical protein